MFRFFLPSKTSLSTSRIKNDARQQAAKQENRRLGITCTWQKQQSEQDANWQQQATNARKVHARQPYRRHLGTCAIYTNAHAQSHKAHPSNNSLRRKFCSVLLYSCLPYASVCGQLADFLHQQWAAPLTTSGMRRNVSHLWTVLGLGANHFQTSDVLAYPRQGVAHHGACPCPPEWMCLACVTLSQWMCPAMWLAGLAHHVASSLCLVLMLQLLSQTVQTCVFCCKHPQWPNMRMYCIICMTGQ